MFWYETQFRHAEAAREQNKREERKLKIEIEKKNGMRAVLKNQMDAVSKEQRRIKRELDRIRKSSVGPTNVFNRSPRRSRIQLSLPFHGKKSTKRMIGRIEPSFNFLTSEYNQAANEHENELMRSIMFFGCETNRKENNSDFNKTLNGQFNDLTTTSDSTSITGPHTILRNCITDINNNTLQSDDNLQHETLSLSTTDNSKSLHISPPQRSSSPVNLFISTNDSHVEYFENEDVLSEIRSDYPENSETSISRSTGSTSKPRHKSLDLLQLASLDMKSVKSNVSRRLSGTVVPQQSELSRRRVSDGSIALAKPTSKVPHSRRRISEGQFPSSKKPSPSPIKSEATNAEADLKRNSSVTPARIEEQPQPTSSTKRTTTKHPKDLPSTLDYNPDYYNPDGTLRAKWNLPDPDEAWERAKNARYLRTSTIRENEKELSINDIFN